MSKLPNLKLLITRTVGTDHIDLDYCKKKNIAVYNIPNYGSYNIAEHTLALMLAGARHLIKATQETQQGKFNYSPHLGITLKNKTIGVIGTGKIGLGLLKRIKPFEAKLLAYDVIKNKKAANQYGFQYVQLAKLLGTSDIISLHVPLLPQTKQMIGEKEIKKMKKGAILINTARGAILDTSALLKHIDKFKAVCLDVLEDEAGFDKTHPLLKHRNVIITPHIGFYTEDTLRNIAHETMQNIERYKNNNKTNRIV